ncbi:MAG: VTT domain-containing protein [Pseudotabrizicola sp.]|uniref:TVP38/TMEM64 family protein n=1 Tax=Pseudotabrizicola sp. TaxID=2939647 RepID=UPI002715AC81|nr:VTT domain-containing protein [Pseudotabrizicola sp.]MDO8883738.1 VTT domain-containing protein [Pseudotabrizicola sp.]MDP2081741.1 VTT domain-containing protein [Pseudotabrizicola sp.]MDZ7573036.1 VTT domain-containing protein [Pseudotabrizicola sp.]
MHTKTEDQMTRPANPWLKRLPFLAIVLVALLGAFLLRDQISFDALAQHRDTLLAFRDSNFILASLVFVAAYVIIVGFSLPGATIATLAGGFLFGLFPGVLYNVGGATVGAAAVFLAARAGFGADVAARIEEKGGAAARLQQGLRENEWSALLIMRLVPAVPFFIANLLPAFVGTSLFRFALTTFVGIIPGTFVFTSVGAGLGEVFARGDTPDLSIIFAPHILGPILGLAALSALPIILKRFKKEV